MNTLKLQLCSCVSLLGVLDNDHSMSQDHIRTIYDISHYLILIKLQKCPTIHNKLTLKNIAAAVSFFFCFGRCLWQRLKSLIPSSGVRFCALEMAFFLSSSMVQVKNGCISNMIVSFHLGFSFQLLSRLLGDSQFFEGSPSLPGGGWFSVYKKKPMDRWDLPPFFFQHILEFGFHIASLKNHWNIFRSSMKYLSDREVMTANFPYHKGDHGCFVDKRSWLWQ